MENPFDLLDQKLRAIEDKIDGLIQKNNNQEKPSSLSTTWVTTKQLAQHLGISTAAITNMRGSIKYLYYWDRYLDPKIKKQSKQWCEKFNYAQAALRRINELR